MANIFLESFDNIATADLIIKGYSNIDASFTIIPGRTNNGLYCSTVGASGVPQNPIYKILPKSYGSIIFGFAFKTTNPMNSRMKIVSFCNDIDEQVYVILTAAGEFQFWLASADGRFDSLIGTSPHVYDFGAYYYFEFKIVFSATATGSINYRVNGVDQTPITAVITANPGSVSPTCNILRLWGQKVTGDGSIGFYYDDMYANDLTGAKNNDYMGDIQVFVLRPFGSAGTTWTAVGAAANVDCVKDITPDYDLTYIYSATATQLDLYTLTAPPAGIGLVKAVQSNLVARKDDAITRQIAPVLGDGVHTPSVAATVSIGNVYVDYLQSYDTNPLTGADWAISDLSTLRLGVKEIA